MAITPDLFIADERVPKVREVFYELYTSKDVRGKPSDQARLARIRITREADEDNRIFRWACRSTKDNFKNGYIKFMNPADKKEMKRLTWDQGFITYYKETYPDFEKEKTGQVYEEFEISAELVSVGDAELDGNWEDRA